MELACDSFEKTVFVYIRLVRDISPEAADSIELILTTYGSRAALRAALLVTILKIEVQQNHWIPNLALYAHLFVDYPDALPLAKYAMLCCLQRWDVAVLETVAWANLEIRGALTSTA